MTWRHALSSAHPPQENKDPALAKLYEASSSSGMGPALRCACQGQAQGRRRGCRCLDANVLCMDSTDGKQAALDFKVQGGAGPGGRRGDGDGGCARAARRGTHGRGPTA